MVEPCCVAAMASMIVFPPAIIANGCTIFASALLDKIICSDIIVPNDFVKMFNINSSLLRISIDKLFV